MNLLVGLSVATGLALIVLPVTSLYSRVPNGGHSLNTFKKEAPGPCVMFALGMVYMMALVSGLHWPKEILFPAIGSWGCGLVALPTREAKKRQRGCGQGPFSLELPSPGNLAVTSYLEGATLGS